MSELHFGFIERWRLALPADLSAGDLKRFVARHAPVLEAAWRELDPMAALASLRGAIEAAPEYGAVIHCGELTLGAHPDPDLHAAGEIAVIDLAQQGGVVVGQGARASRALLASCGPVRVLGALGRALLKLTPQAPLQGAIEQVASLAREAERIDVTGGPGDAKLRLGLAMRAVALSRLGGAVEPFAFMIADDIAYLKMSARDRAFLAPSKAGDGDGDGEEDAAPVGVMASYRPYGVGEPAAYGISPVKHCAADGVGGPCWGQVALHDRRDARLGRVAKPLCQGHLGGRYTPPIAAPQKGQPPTKGAQPKTAQPRAYPTSVVVVKGCPELGIRVRDVLQVAEVKELGREYSHSARLVLMHRCKALNFDVTHPNRILDAEFNARRGSCSLRLAPYKARPAKVADPAAGPPDPVEHGARYSG